MTAVEQPAPSSTDERIGNNVHAMLWNRRIQQRELALKLGVTGSVLSKKLRGVSGWSAVQVDVAASFFDVDPGVLYSQPTVPKFAPKLVSLIGGGHTTHTNSPLLQSVPTGNNIAD